MEIKEAIRQIETLENKIKELQSKLSECETKRKLEADRFLKDLEEIQDKIKLVSVNECEEATVLKDVLVKVLSNQHNEAIKTLLEFVI